MKRIKLSLKENLCGTIRRSCANGASPAQFAEKNALKYSTPNQIVEVEVESQGKQTQIKILDRGIGSSKSRGGDANL